MHPLNTFSDLLDFTRISPTILRFVIGLFIISLGYDRIRKSLAITSILYFIFGTTLILGFYTQISAIVGVGILKLDFYLDYWKNRKTNPVPRNFYILYIIPIVILISLLFTGAGAWAFDMPF